MKGSKRRQKTVIRLDLVNACLWRGVQRIPLKPKDFSVLRYLAEHAGQLVTKAALLDAVWPGVVVTETVLKACISRLRQALGDQAHAPQFIETVHRRGYCWIAPFTTIPSLNLEPEALHQASAGHAPLSLSVQTVDVTPQMLDSPFVGRETELASLHERLTKAFGGERQAVFVTGEAGLGKTTLVDTFLAAAHSQELWIGRGQCIEHYGGSEAYMPILEAFGRLARGPDRQTIIACLTQHAPTWLVQMPGLLSDRDLNALRRRTVGTTRERMLRELAEAIDVLTVEKPLILLLEDLQWSDASTLDLLATVARRREPARLLLLGTYRSADLLPHDHPFPMVMQELQMHRLCAELRLELLSEGHVAEYLARRFAAGALQDLPLRELARIIYLRTEGHPLFMVMMVEDWLTRGFLHRENGRWELSGELGALQLEAPVDARRMIETQLRRLSAEERRVVEAGSVAGMEFSAVAVAAGVNTKVEQAELICADLARRNLFLRSCGMQHWPDGDITGSYEFAHVLYQEVIYSQIPTLQRIDLHRRIGAREEAGFGMHAGTKTARLAMHFERGGDYSRAVQYHQQAAQNAVRRSGYQEALTHATAGVALLEYLPDTSERTECALRLHHLQGVSLAAIKGTAAVEVEQVYARAYPLIHQVEEPQLAFPILLGLWNFYILRGILQSANPLAKQLLRLAQQTYEKGSLLEAHLSSGMGMLYSGEIVTARSHLERCLALHDVQRSGAHLSIYGADPGVVVHGHAAWALWLLGYPTQARQQSQAALTLAHHLAHPFSLTFALAFTATLYQLRHEAELACEHAQVAMTLAAEHGFAPWAAMGTVLYGWARVLQGQRKEGVMQMQHGLQAWRDTGAEVGRLHWLTLLAEAYGQLEQSEEGLRALDEALRIGTITGERMYEAEVYRLYGELSLQKGARDRRRLKVGSPSGPDSNVALIIAGEAGQEAERCFLKAIEIARQQQAKSWELRAAMSLARLWRKEGKQREACKLLADIYYWFTEGFDTRDLQEAKALLRELAEPLHLGAP